MFAGCTASHPDPIKTKYVDADRRFGQSVDGGFTDLREIKIPEKTAELSLRASFRVDQGISFTFRDPDGRLTRSINFAGPAEAHDIAWVETTSPKPGTWRFGLECPGHCEYAFGFYFEDAVDDGPEVSARYPDAEKRFSLAGEGATQQSHDFNIPDGTSRVAVKWSARATDGFAFSLLNPSTTKMSAMSFPDHVTVDDLWYVITEKPEAGPWRFQLSCDHACDYAFGFYYD